ncbi:hypothetical protein QTG54_003627 [Skeletonema marinoi]|uniref:MYND-type domain-containing protein n=1 Tax=Skeletonema marinoi TaxID=267567 RepID=A0AAD8YG90_9STRA|nr:hypothetical protein QTG54_003627 [Skeletonema marinoi]
MPSSKKKKSKQKKAANVAAAASNLSVNDDPYEFDGEIAVEQLNNARAAVGLNRVDPRPKKVDRLPDYPACDGCGSEYSGTMECTSCGSAFYCGRSCQVNHWKNGGHKDECPTLKERSQSIAKTTVEKLMDESSPPLLRVQVLHDDPLDGSGPYKFAVDYGLHDAIYSAFLVDKEGVVENHTNENPLYRCCLTQWIMQSLFRGERISRQIHHGSNSFGKVDGGRILGYLHSHSDDGLQVWWKASLESAMVFLHSKISSTPDESFRCHQMARDIWAMWTHTFASKRASECILLTHDKAACLERATWMIKQMKPYLSKLQSAREGLDRNEVIQAYFNQVPAMIAAQCRELANVTSVDPVKLLKLRGLDKKMYENIAKPHGEDMIRRKRAADTARSRDILKRAGAFD